MPQGDLIKGSSPIVFITQLREPIARAMSQYRFWVNRRIDVSGPEAFLKHPVSKNFQVKKIAGCEDLDLAMENITKYFMLAGIVEDFDSFLVLLAQQLELPLEKFVYRKKNVNNDRGHVSVPQDFADRLHERNQLDLKLYNWVKSVLLREYVERYSGDFASDLQAFKSIQRSAVHARIKPLVDSVYRNAYIKPISGLIRVTNGLPYVGSYAVE